MIEVLIEELGQRLIVLDVVNIRKTTVEVKLNAFHGWMKNNTNGKMKNLINTIERFLIVLVVKQGLI